MHGIKEMEIPCGCFICISALKIKKKKACFLSLLPLTEHIYGLINVSSALVT